MEHCRKMVSANEQKEQRRRCHVVHMRMHWSMSVYCREGVRGCCVVVAMHMPVKGGIHLRSLRHVNQVDVCEL